ncbi:MAG TPA: triose-phosphate isomerase [Polyangiaceae bacterium]|jgi:triosephosphate isomerase|nr:triose-phosphate isomerase [Polyangiaceae bacterium]
MSKKLRALIAGNWKMNQGTESGLALAKAIVQGQARAPNADLVIAPPFTLLAQVSSAVAGSRVEVSGQNMHQAANGAFTGEISAEMLKAAGCRWVILGHSERRQYFGETDQSVQDKTRAAFAAGLGPIVCVGETLAEREAGSTFEVVSRQLAAVEALLAEHVGIGAIAYEPVWAIGTGKVATTEQAQEVHAAIRAQLARRSSSLASGTRILYGGSVKPDNAAALLACTDIDGALVGGASLKAEDFLQIAAGAG